MRDGIITDWIHADKEDLARKLECWETDEWAVRSILEKEILSKHVTDPCCGMGMLGRVAEQFGYDVHSIDIYDWGYEKLNELGDFLKRKEPIEGSILMNPPFSKACLFVDHALELGASKIVCFQRFAWYEGAYNTGKKRGMWWDKNPPSRVYICGDRATCRRMDIDPSKDMNSTTTAHSWFIWDKSQIEGTQLLRIYKGESHKQGDLL